MVMLYQFCFAPEKAAGLDFTLGLDVAGPYGGTWHVHVQDAQLAITEGDIAGCQAILHFQDAEAFCLNAYGRTSAGAVEGDQAIVNRFSGLFFSL